MDRIGRYKIVRELGRGAMGVAYHAIDPNISCPVAIKTIQIGGLPESLKTRTACANGCSAKPLRGSVNPIPA